MRQFFVLLWKCWLIRRQHYVWTVFEIFLPIVIASAALIAHGDKGGASIEDPIRYKPVHIGKQLRSYYTMLYTPVNDFTNNLMSRLSESVECRGVETEEELDAIIRSEIPFTISDSVEKLLLGLQENETIAGVIFDLPPEGDVANLELSEGGEMPVKLNYTLRVRDFELGRDAFPKKQDFGPFPNADHYIKKNFIAIEVLINHAYLQMLSEQLYDDPPNLPEIREIRAKRFPYPKYIKHPRFQTSIITRFFPGTGKLNTLQLTIEYTTVLGFVVMIVLLMKGIVDEKLNRAREMLRLMGMSDWTYFSSQFTNTFVIMAIQCVMLTVMFCLWPNAQLQRASWTLLIAILLVYSAAAITFGMMLTIFFKKPTNAMIVGFIVWLSVQEIISILFEKRAGLTETSGLIRSPEWFHLLLCLIPNYALKVVNELLVECEVYAAYGTFVPQYQVYSATWRNLFNVLPLYKWLNILGVMIMMAISCVLYGAIIWYFDVLRWNNTRKGKKLEDDCGFDNQAFENEKNNLKAYFEEDPTLKVGIIAEDLRKEFPDKVAVQNVTMKIFHGQITVLLGHNGAGKTTFASMITGLHQPTRGSLIVDGIDAIKNPEKARQTMGLCPQHDVLYDELTCSEHLRLFATVKGCPEEDMKGEVTKILDQLGLTDKANVLSKDLSGGMKRRLSLGMAMINNTKILILDEPTSGLDPEARRGVWDFLLSIRKDRVILLTTHWMEEADVLGDRIAIMSTGQIKCCGSSVFLKRTFAGGYHLRIAKSPDDWKSSKFDSFIKKHLPRVELENETQNEIRYAIHSDDTPLLPDFFDELEKSKSEFGIYSCGVNVSSMDDVFLKVIGQFDDGFAIIKDKHNNSNNGLHKESDKQMTAGDYTRLKLKALLYKRGHDSKRSLKTLLPIMTIAIGCIFALLGLIQTTVITTKNTENWDLAMDSQSIGYDKSLFGFFYQEVNDSSLLPYYVEAGKEEHVAVSHFTYLPTETLLNNSVKDLNLYRERNIVGFSLERYRNRLMFVCWYNGEAQHSLPISVNVLYNALARKLIAESNATRLAPGDVTINVRQRTFEHFNPHSAFLPWFGRVYNSIFIPFSVSFIGAFYVLFPTHERVTKVNRREQTYDKKK